MPDVGTVLAALADPRRRTIFETLVTGRASTATALASELDISRQAVAKHLGQLSSAGLVRGSRVGRELRFHSELGPLDEITDWIQAVGAQWDQRLAALRTHLDGAQ